MARGKLRSSSSFTSSLTAVSQMASFFPFVRGFGGQLWEVGGLEHSHLHSLIVSVIDHSTVELEPSDETS